MLRRFTLDFIVNRRRFSFKASDLEIVKTKIPKEKIPKQELLFGRTFSDHMLEIEWNKSMGWSKPSIKPYGPLQLYPSSSVFHYATECFEGLKAYKDSKDENSLRLFRPEINMERLLKSAQRLSFPDFDAFELLTCIKELIRIEKDWIPKGTGYSLYIRPTIIATTECIGVSQPDRILLYVICSPVGPYFKSAGFSAIKILAEDSFVRAWPGGTGEFKIGANYGPTILPQKLAGSKGFQQILWLLGKDLEITEIGSMNCFILLKEHEYSDKLELVTPPLTDGTILPGVTRDSILKMTRKWNEFKVSERSINMAEFLESHAQNRIVEMFGAGTAAIVSPIKCLNFHGKDYEIPLNPLEPEKQAGPLTERLFKLITQIQYGDVEHEWSFKIVLIPSPYGHRDFQRQTHTRQSSPHMDESVFTSPLESNLNRLIFDQFSHWRTQFKQFLKFTDLVKELEELKCQSLEKLKSEKLPSNCSQWIKTTSNSSCDFVVLFSSDFRPKLAKELADIEQEQRDAIKCLKEAQDNVKQFSDIILENLKELLIYFKRGKSTPNATSKDPWMNELTIRHFSAKFLDKKSEYLVTLYRVFTQIRHLHTELNHKLAVYSDEFLRIMERFGLAQVDEKPSQLDFGSLNLSATPNGTASFDSILKNYSLNYEWKLNCPPLDGFLSTLYNHLKSLGADFTIETGNVPKIFSENSLRFGFLQKLISGILTRNWQVNFAILQPSTGFLHLFKVNREKGSRTTDGENNNVTIPSGHLLVPSAVNSYTKSSLHDLNVLATQFHLQSPHHPAAISPQTLTPFLSIPIGPNCKIMATDPITFTFSIKLTGGEKFYFKAFCEEEFVDWVIFLNETVKKTSGVTKSAVEKEKSSEKNSPTLSEEAANSSSSASSSSSSPPTNTQMNQNTATTTFSSMAPIADLENPWE